MGYSVTLAVSDWVSLVSRAFSINPTKDRVSMLPFKIIEHDKRAEIGNLLFSTRFL